MSIGSRILALVAVAFLGWASVADNPAVCPDEQAQGDGHRHETPASSHCCCLTAPCHTPTALRPPEMPAAPAGVLAVGVPAAPRALTSIDSPAPPTPPPTALD